MRELNLAKYADRINAARTKGMKSMWYMVLTHEVMLMLDGGTAVTKDNLREALTARRATAPKLLHDTFDGALEVLDEPWPDL